MKNFYIEELKQIIIDVSNNRKKAIQEANFFDRTYRFLNEEYPSRMSDVCASYDIDKDLTIDERFYFVEGMSFADKQLQFLEDNGFGKSLTEEEKRSYVNYQLQLIEERGLISYSSKEKRLFKKGLDSSISLYFEDNYSFKSEGVK